MTTPKQVAISIIKRAEGNELERFKREFCGYTPLQMAGKFGASAQTCQEILDICQSVRDHWQAALDWVEAQPE